VTGLRGPCGLTLRGDKLWTVERGALVEIDIPSGKVINKYPIPASTFLNDLTITEEGIIYISDSFPVTQRKNATIYKYEKGEIEVWLEGEEISRANGLFIHDGLLIIGNTEDHTLKAVDLETRKLTTVASLGWGVADGISINSKGNYIVSRWEGQAYEVPPNGDLVELLDIMPQGLNAADIEYIKEKDLLVIPTFAGNRVVAYRIR